LIIKHTFDLRKALDNFSKEVDDLLNKWYPKEQQDPNSRFTQSNFYNSDELRNTIDMFSAFAFGVVVDFAFAHGKLFITLSIIKEYKYLITVVD
jgi:hypothetical protein